MRTLTVLAVRTISLVVGLFLLSGVVWAQSTAQINGTVKDQSGAVLPGVEVTVTQTDTGVKRTTPTDETGSYILPNLPLGPYRLEAELPGFRTYVQTGIVLQVSANPTINPVLAVGQVSEQARTAMWRCRASGVLEFFNSTSRFRELSRSAKGSRFSCEAKPSIFQII